MYLCTRKFFFFFFFFFGCNLSYTTPPPPPPEQTEEEEEGVVSSLARILWYRIIPMPNSRCQMSNFPLSKKKKRKIANRACVGAIFVIFYFTYEKLFSTLPIVFFFFLNNILCIYSP
jgi:hypothetical protein